MSFARRANSWAAASSNRTMVSAASRLSVRRSPLLGVDRFLGVASLEQVLAALPQDFAFGDRGHADFRVVDLAQARDNPLVVRPQVGQGVGVKQAHRYLSGWTSGRPRSR
jgi:hypothetical protein